MSNRTLAALVLCSLSLSACQQGGPAASDSDLLFEDQMVPLTAGDTASAMCSGNPALQERMSQTVNAAREAEAKTILDIDDKLTGIAQSHACDIAARGEASVTGSDGSNIVDRARAVNYPTCGVVQLIAVGGTPEEVVAAWLGQRAQRTELLGQISDEIGAGVASGPDGRLWWSVVMGDDCNAPWRLY